MDLWEKIEPGDLSEEQKGILELVGIEVYKRLVEYFGGQSIYIAKLDTITRSLRDRKILEEFNGSNYAELARRYGLSVRAIRNVVDSSDCHSRYCKKNQISLFEEGQE